MLDLKKLLYKICVRLYNIGIHQFEGPTDHTETVSGRYYKVASMDLAPGTWILMGHVWFAYVNTSGFRRAYFTADNFSNGTTTAPSNYAMAGYQEFAASAFGEGRADIKAGPIYVNIGSEGATLSLVAYQGSSKNINANGRIYAVKVV